MAVENKYADTVREAGERPSSLYSGAASIHGIVATVAVASGDDNGSIYRLFTVPSNAVILSFAINNSAITNGTDYDIGLYKQSKGVEVDKDALADGLSMASARAMEVANNVGLTDVAIASAGSTLGEISGQTAIDSAYEIALTANVVGSASGTIVAKIIYATP